MSRHTKPLSVSGINAARNREKPIILYDGGGLELLIRPPRLNDKSRKQKGKCQCAGYPKPRTATHRLLAYA